MDKESLSVEGSLQSGHQPCLDLPGEQKTYH